MKLLTIQKLYKWNKMYKLQFGDKNFRAHALGTRQVNVKGGNPETY